VQRCQTEFLIAAEARTDACRWRKQQQAAERQPLQGDSAGVTTHYLGLGSLNVTASSDSADSPVRGISEQDPERPRRAPR
jgi:hypothetical protein